MGMIGEVREIARDAWGFFKPPMSGNSAEDAWRMKVVGSLALLAFALGGHMFLSDTLPWSGPVARAGEQKEIKDTLAALLAQNTKNYKISLGQEICRVYRLRNMAARDSLLWIQLNGNYEEKQTEYTGLNKGLRYPVVECMAE